MDRLPRPSHVWLQLHRQMVPRLLPLEAVRENGGLSGGGLSRQFLFHSGIPQKLSDLKPSPGRSNP